MNVQSGYRPIADHSQNRGFLLSKPRQDGFPKQHPVTSPWTVPGPAGVVEATLSSPFTTYLVLIFHAGQRYPMGGGRSPLLVTDHTLSIPSPNK